MSCCDNSVFLIVNSSPAEFTVTTTTHTLGSTHDISPGDTIPAGQSLTAYAYSGGGTDGEASGTMTITSGTYNLALPYHFTPKNNFGKCPCTTASQSNANAGNFQAVAAVKDGSNDGEASITWTITSVPG